MLLLRLALAVLVAVGGCSSTQVEPGLEGVRVLVFTKTAGYRHASIPDGVAALREIGDARGVEVDATEDSLAFTGDGLAPYAAVVFLNTTGDVLGRGGEAALRAFVEGGGGFVGVHAAADTEYDWPWFGRLVGARFESHPAVQEAALVVADAEHAATRALPARWVRTDEWYNFQAPPEGVRVLLRLDASTYRGRDDGGRARGGVGTHRRERSVGVHGARAHGGELRRPPVPGALGRGGLLGGPPRLRPLARHRVGQIRPAPKSIPAPRE